MKGRVLKVIDDKVELRLFCDAKKASMDGHCGACQALKTENNNSDIIIAQNTINAKIGDEVELGLKEHAELKSATILLMVPLAIFIVALGVANGLHLSVWASVLIGVLTLGITYASVKLIYKNKTYYYLLGGK
ncbi:positive regulator of sigma E, RseC/MucC [Chloroherpeton thalassium ATCC 35110]|uniref:Positive regulator of sigma E, RseC/MucC n=1 Tax=Chloroherpeton thalassium (strain ATCC 35110 / GB-78) TaxID=517418 RepID=B3QTB7_CHLT3|nr:SoxR reducing system RseC family protein [Chloroherpeton thalassium]ACF14216.1 positive regulator of sigma E, RseC/MucC [Chloroherpeton thalassium ATCC 35110]